MKKLTLTVILSSLLMSQAMAQPQSTSAMPLKSDTDKFSYTLGYNLANTLKQTKTTINPDALLRGVEDGINSTKPLLTKKQQHSIMQTYQQHMMHHYEQQTEKQSDANTKKGQSFLANNAKQKGVVTLKNGLQYKVLIPGKGNSPKASDQVTVDYEGKLIDGTVFDSSYQRGKPMTFYVNEVIKGWQQALQMMKPGATWMLYIPANLAYGNRSMGKISAGSTLIFKVHLISVK